MLRFLCAFVTFGILTFAVNAATLTGRVVGVHDGDTITVLDAAKTQHKIRLSGIDAPELKQAFGTRSKIALSEMVYGKQVKVDWDKLDRYGRTIGVIFVDGRDANLAQVRAGMAWWYRQYAKEQTRENRQLYELGENDARNAKRGLWADSTPVPPWEWRRQDRRR